MHQKKCKFGIEYSAFVAVFADMLFMKFVRNSSDNNFFNLKNLMFIWYKLLSKFAKFRILRLLQLKIDKKYFEQAS